MLPLVNRVSAGGVAIAVVVGLALAAIVEQKVLPVKPRHQPVAGPRPVRAKPHESRASRSAQRQAPVSPMSLLDQKVKKVALTQRGATARREYGAKTVASPVVGVSRSDKRHTWAFGTAAIPPPSGEAVVPESSVYVAHASGKTWKVELAGTPGFDALLRKMPTSVLPADERTTLTHYSTSVKAAAGSAGLMLPWSVGQSWTLLPGAHGVSFTGGDGRVLAATGGRIYRLCSTSPDRGLILLIAPDGRATVYYQVDQITQVPDGGLVKQGDYLGRTSTDLPCGGGKAADRLVRFGLRNAAGPVALDGMTISGWVLHQTATTTFAERDGLRVAADNPLLNFGGSVPAAPTPTPTPAASKSGKPNAAPLVPSEGVNGQK